MKRINYLYLLPLSLAFAFCTKVIKVDLKDADKKYVIEANLDDSPQGGSVRISRSKNFSERTPFEKITNANVTITDNAGNTETLTQSSPGLYTTTNLLGTPGRSYFLTVKIGDETFSATSSMPQKVNMDTLYVAPYLDYIDTIDVAHVRYQDPAGIKNYYRHVLYVKKKFSTKPDLGFYLSTDDLTDGKYQDFLIFGKAEFGVGGADSIKVEMQCIDEATYTYYSTLSRTIEASAAAPTNPINNIKGALGYFSAHTKQVKRIKVPL